MYTHWEKINEAINTTLTLDRDIRMSYLKQTFSDEPDILQEALDYLSFIEKAEAEQFLEPDLLSQSRLADEISSIINQEESLKHIIGKQIGPYEITELIGEGGMGAVYLAERTEGGFEQKVAIKFMRSGFFSLYLRERFNGEKQILSKLNHPNIARLLDGGITDDGSPYFIMEYVEGEPVDLYCRNHQLNLAERISLFLDICKAVQHAHSRFIIHRDLKPENIYITTDGDVKVMDFGIAKLLSPDEAESTIRTREGQIIASFDFAAPEQVGASGEPSVETDVYGLGALLYLLCTDERPFQFKEKSLAEIESEIRQTPPPRPGDREKDSIGPIPKDLEAIILKCLRKEPENRYESTIHLREDVERYQKGWPVQARKGTLRYKSVKFLKRNKAVLGMLTIFLCTVIGFTLYHIQKLTEERNISQAEAEKARAVTGFLTGIFKHASPYTQPDTEITAREILDYGTDYIQTETRDQPDIRSSLLYTVGGIYHILGSYEKSEQLLTEALELEKSLDNPSHNYDLAVIHHNFGNLKLSQGDYPAAINHYKEAAFIFNDLNLQGYRAGSLADWGWNEYRLGNYEKADSLIRMALPINIKEHGNNSSETAYNLRSLGWLYHDRGNYEKADSLFGEVLNIYRELYSHDHPELATTLHSLGWTKYQLRKYEEAASLYQEAIEMRRRIFNHQPHADIAWSLNNLGIVRQAQGEYDEAEQLFTNALKMRREILPENHPHISQSLGNLGSVYFYKKQYDESISTFREVVNIQRNVFGPDHPNLAMYINNLATVLSKSGRSEDAIPYFQQAVEIEEKNFSITHPSTLQMRSNLADAYEAIDSYREAEIIRIENFEALRNDKGMDDAQTQLTLKSLIQLYEKWNQPEKRNEYHRFLTSNSAN